MEYKAKRWLELSKPRQGLLKDGTNKLTFIARVGADLELKLKLVIMGPIALEVASMRRAARQCRGTPLNKADVRAQGWHAGV